LQCGQEDGMLILYQNGYRKADDLLNEYKPLWKDPEKKTNTLGKKPNGGGIIFSEDIPGDRKEVDEHLNTLLDQGSLPEDIESAFEKLCKLSEEEDSHVRMIDNDMLGCIIKYLRSDNPAFQRLAASLIMNISDKKKYQQ